MEFGASITNNNRKNNRKNNRRLGSGRNGRLENGGVEVRTGLGVKVNILSTREISYVQID